MSGLVKVACAVITEFSTDLCFSMSYPLPMRNLQSLATSRRKILSTMTGAALASPFLPTGASDGSSVKKGWCGGDPKLHKLFRTSWYYTWSPKTRPSHVCEFVPMMKGSWSLNQAPAVQQMKGITSLLGFNEPSRAKQGNISVSDALKLWPKLEAIAEKNNLRLGSPAPTSDQKGIAWHRKFMEEAKKRRLRIDFVAIHWYGGRNADAFENFIKRFADNYGKPVWMTEFNGWDGPEPENYDFLKKALKFMERSRDVERYAYFNKKKGTPLSLLKADGSPSRIGELYRDT